jgi:hypothetical protein
MDYRALLKSCLDSVARFEQAMDFDRVAAQDVRLGAIEAKLAELAADRPGNATDTAPVRPRRADRALGG